jgi:hypothetical protein
LLNSRETRFAAFYCEPGIEGAHEKGGVEGQVGYFCRNYLVPEVDSLGELNALLVPLPDEPFETGLLLTPRVDRYSQVTVRMNRYSVPVRLIGRQVRVVLRSSELVIYDGRREAARHERAARRGGEALVLDHYLEALMRKPGALAGSVPLDQARACGVFTGAHEALWSAARRAFRRACRDPRPDRGPAAAPAHERRRRHHRDRGGAVGRRARRRRRRGRGPQGRRRPGGRARPGQRRRRERYGADGLPG